MVRTISLAACVLAAGATTSRAQPVTNGTPTSADPAVFAIVDAQGRVACTATLVAPYTAISASHCVFGVDPRTLRAAFGASVANAKIIAISAARTHPAFVPATFQNDVAMLTLRESAPATPLALDTTRLDGTLVGTTFRVVGYGITAGGLGDSGTKREGIARVSEVTASELTAVPDPSQPCRGDSGGPALLSPTAIAAVVSRGDALCTQYATYARIDAVRAALVDPYLTDTAPGTVNTGDACLYDTHCAEGPCLETNDDPLLYFCSAACGDDDDCPDAMDCASDRRCRYPEPSPGALGSTCATDDTCTSRTCRDGTCTVSCAGGAACPVGFECEGEGPAQYCYADDSGCGCSSSGSPLPALVLLAQLGLLELSRRRARNRVDDDKRIR